MANQNNDEVARALAALAGGAIPSEPETPSSGIPSESIIMEEESAMPLAAPLFAPNAVPLTLPVATPIPRRAGLAPATITRAASSPMAAAPPAASSVPMTPPLSPVVPPMPIVPPMPVVPPLAKVRPSSSSKRPTAPNRPDAPASLPLLPASEITAQGTAQNIYETWDDAVPSEDFLSEIIDDDAVVIAPAPDLSAFAPKMKRPAAKTRLYAQTSFRRTLIPILLTGGMLLIWLGSWSGVDRAGLLGGLDVKVDTIFIFLGLILLLLGLLNMLHVKHILNGDISGRR